MLNIKRIDSSSLKWHIWDFYAFFHGHANV